MSTASKLLRAGLGSLAIGVTGQANASTGPAADPIHRLHEIRAAYLKSIGKPEPEAPAWVRLAQWANFPNFPNWTNWNNWFNGWKNF
jgi:hypothetical protein